MKQHCTQPCPQALPSLSTLRVYASQIMIVNHETLMAGMHTYIAWFLSNVHKLEIFTCTYAPSPSHPGYFGKVGMRHYHLTRNKYHCPTVNLDKLWSLVSEQVRLKFQDETEKAPIIDVVRAVSS